jgi:hypothetical protein
MAEQVCSPKNQDNRAGFHMGSNGLDMGEPDTSQQDAPLTSFGVESDFEGLTEQSSMRKRL